MRIKVTFPWTHDGRPIVRGAIQYTGDNLQEILDFAEHVVFTKERRRQNKKETALYFLSDTGTVRVPLNYWIVQGEILGRYYLMEPDCFEWTFRARRKKGKNPCNQKMTTA